MHLALIIPSLNAGGAERALTALANHWAIQGHKISLITLSSPAEKPFYSLHPDIEFIPLSQINSTQRGAYDFLQRIIRRILCLRRKLSDLKPSVIISFLEVMNITTLLASYGLKISVIVAERTHPAFHPLPFIYQLLRRLTYRWAQYIAVQTEGAAQYFSGALSSKTRIIPNAVKLPAITKNSRECLAPIRNLISVGRLIPSKGFDTLIQAFAAIQSQHSALGLTIYGEGPEWKNLEDLIQSLGFTSKIHLPGTTPRIYEALTKADLFIFPSRYEGFPNALCEAMSVGLPVITSNCSGSVDIVRDGIDGRLFPVGDEKALAETIQELINDPEQRQRLSANALTITERFSEQRIYDLWDELLSKVIPNSS